MTDVMTPSQTSEITDGQINKAVSLYRALLEKHRSELMSEPAQQVLGQSELAADMLAVFRRRIEAFTGMITRRVKVNRALPPQAVLDETARKQYTNQAAVDSMSQGEGDEVEFKFFKPDMSKYPKGYLTDEEAEAERELRGLKADPRAQAAVNRDDPAFADTHPNGCSWKKDGKWNFAAFYRWNDERHVNVNRNDHGWDDDWWLGGVSK